jgi:hypothetical protein
MIKLRSVEVRSIRMLSAEMSVFSMEQMEQLVKRDKLEYCRVGFVETLNRELFFGAMNGCQNRSMQNVE